MSELKQCPCGETPTKLHLKDNGQGYKYVSVTPECCGDWTTECRTVNYETQSVETYVNAVKAWNDLPRGWVDDKGKW